jgi:hypothetical protein
METIRWVSVMCNCLHGRGVPARPGTYRLKLTARLLSDPRFPGVQTATTFLEIEVR